MHMSLFFVASTHNTIYHTIYSKNTQDHVFVIYMIYTNIRRGVVDTRKYIVLIAKPRSAIH